MTLKLPLEHRGAYAVLGLELLSQVRERQHPGHDDHEAEEDDTVVESGRQDRSRDQMQECEDRDLLIVSRSLSVREARDLQEGRVLDAHRQRGFAPNTARDLHEQKYHRRDVPEPRIARAVDERRLGEPARHEGDHDDERIHRREGGAEHQGDEPQAGEHVGDQLVSEGESHAAHLPLIRFRRFGVSVRIAFSRARNRQMGSGAVPPPTMGD